MRVELNYAYLHEAFPIRTITPVEEEPPIYSDNQIKTLSEIIKPYDKLRFVDENLQIETRLFSGISRMKTGDNRYKVLDYLKTLPKSDYLAKIVDVLCTSTYKNDKKFIEECQEFYILKTSKL